MEDVFMKGGREWPEISFGVVVAFASIWLIIALLVRNNSVRARKPLPPGPRGWPVLGSLLSLGTDPHISLYNLSKKYGPLMYMHLGYVPTLIVSSKDMAKEVLKTNDQIMASRPDLHIFHVVFYDRQDLAFAPYGQYWRNVRKICIMELFTSSRLAQFQGVRQRLVLAMLHSVLDKSEQGQAVNMANYFSSLTMNNITQTMTNKSYCAVGGESAYSKSTSFASIVREMFELLGAFNLADYIPFLRHFDLQGFNKRMADVHEKMDTFLENMVEEHREKKSSAGKQEKSSQDFVDLLLGLSFEKDSNELLSNVPIKAILTDMINGGTDTSATNLEWILAELLRNPRLVKRAQEELDSVVGPERLVEETDIPELKYIQALVKEGLRLHSPAPLLVPHESMEDCVIAGYRIPARTRVLVNAWAIHRDEAFWERPLEFNPDRFLNSSVDVKGQDFELIPFGSGRRMCPAMNMGHLIVQYALAQMLHTANWSLPEGQKPEDLDMSASFGLVLPRKVPLKVSAKPRLAAHVIYPPQ